MIELSKPFLPPKKLTNGFFDLIWNSHRLTNNGPLLQKFEDQLKDYFKIDNISEHSVYYRLQWGENERKIKLLRIK